MCVGAPGPDGGWARDRPRLRVCSVASVVESLAPSLTADQVRPWSRTVPVDHGPRQERESMLESVTWSSARAILLDGEALSRPILATSNGSFI